MDRVAVSLQRRRKGLVQRRAFQEMRRNAVIIQAAARMHQRRQGYLALRAATTSVQAVWRGAPPPPPTNPIPVDHHPTCTYISSPSFQTQSRLILPTPLQSFHHPYRLSSPPMSVAPPGFQMAEIIYACETQPQNCQDLAGRLAREAIAAQHSSATAIQAAWRGHTAHQR